jgi:hypothetical protein
VSIFRPDLNEFRRRDFPAWPGPAKSDEQGRFILRGLSRDLLCRLLVEDPRFALPSTFMQTAENIYALRPLRAVDLKPGGPDHEVDLSLRHGLALSGRAVGPDGKPVRDAWVCSRLMLRTQPDGGWKLFVLSQDHSRSPVRDGRFILHGLDPGSAVEIPAYFLEPQRKLGAIARFSGRSLANGPVTVRLEPCGTAKLRLVNSDGKHLDRYPAIGLVARVVTSGPQRGLNQANDGPLLADEAGVDQLDPTQYSYEFQSDAQGRLTLPALIPGATYRVEDFTAAFAGGDPVIRKEFTVRSGETLDLGDIVIARPRARN